MSKNITNGGDATPRRAFLKQTAAVTGAVLLGSSLLNAQAVASVETLSDAELRTAAELLAEIKGSAKAGLLIVIVEHFAALAAKGAGREAQISVRAIRDQIIGDAHVADLRSETLTTLAADYSE
jgi:hypothetical protein